MNRRHLQLMFAVMSLIWGSTWVAAKIGLAVVPPMLFVGTRCVVAGGLLLAWSWHDLRQLRRADLPRLTMLVVLLAAAPYAMLFWGAARVSSGLTAILNLAFMPIALLGLGALLGQERLTPARIAGGAVGLAGMALLFGPKAIASRGSAAELWPCAVIVLATLVYALGSLLARALLARIPPALLASITMFPGGLLLIAVSLVFEPGAAASLATHWGRPALLAWSFLVLFGSIVGYTIYLVLVREWGAARAGTYAFVSPAIATLLGVVTLHEAVNVLDALGTLTMLAGAWLTLRTVA